MRADSHRRFAVLILSLTMAGMRSAGPASPMPQGGAVQGSDGELIAVNGTELFVRRLNPGGGEPIVIVHGGPVMEHGYLLEWLAPLAESHELVFYDQRLSGRSAAEVPEESVRVATFVDDIEALRQTLGLGRIHLMAHSWGAHLALRFALRHGDALLSLMLLDAMPPSTELWQREEAALQERLTDQERSDLARMSGSDAVTAGDPDAIAAMLRASYSIQFHDPVKLARLQLYVPDDYLARSRRFGAMMVDLSSFDLVPRLSEIDVPTLVLYGGDEPGLELGGAALRQGIPGARSVVIEDAGHFPFVEQPARFLAAIRGFLAGVEGS